MDAVTHALAGFALARAGLDKLTPLAAPIAVLGAVVPDIDIVARLGGPLTYLEWHRTATHSFLMAPVLAIAVVAAVRLAGHLSARGPLPWRGAWFVAFIAVVSHILLDALTTRGVMWLWPVSDRWFYAGLTETGDPWLGVILSLAVIVPFFSRLVGSEIGAHRSSGRGAAIFALLLGVLYLGVRQQLHLRALAVLESRLYDREAPKRVAAVPNLWNPFVWLGLVDTGGSLREMPMDLLREFDPDAGQTFYPPEASKAIDRVKDCALYVKIAPHLQWSRWEAIPFEDHTIVRVEDLRTGLRGSFTVDSGGRVVKEEYRPPYAR